MSRSKKTRNDLNVILPWSDNSKDPSGANLSTFPFFNIFWSIIGCRGDIISCRVGIIGCLDICFLAVYPAKRIAYHASIVYARPSCSHCKCPSLMPPLYMPQSLMPPIVWSYDDHAWSSCMMIMHDDHARWSCMMIMHDHHGWSS